MRPSARSSSRSRWSTASRVAADRPAGARVVATPLDNTPQSAL